MATAPVLKEEHLAKLPGPIFRTPWLVLAFSVFYFADVSLRASEKFLWYDEIFTLYFSRLPDLHSLWAALNQGVDFNPPLFYLLTRGSCALFGEGNVAMRLPEIIGFWIFCVCLFRFVGRRAGTLAGFAAMLLPILTGAYFYAYEARPHGIVLGACGLALVCWQMAMETTPANRRWLTGLAASLLGAFLLHCYALLIVIPFALTEIFRTIRCKRIDWGVWAALALPAIVSLPMYVMLLRSYEKLNASGDFSLVAIARWNEVAHFYVFLLSPCILVVAGVLILFAVAGVRQSLGAGSPFVFQDVFLGVAFTTLPIFGVALGKVVNSPSFSRYFLSALAGVCITVGMGTGTRLKHSWMRATLVVLLVLAGIVNFSRLLKDRAHGNGETLVEPSTHFMLDTTPGQPLDIHPLLAGRQRKLPIVVLSALDFIYLVHYDPQIAGQLYFVTPSESSFLYHGLVRFTECCGIRFNPPAIYRQFVDIHNDYLVYGDRASLINVAMLSELDCKIETLRVVDDHFLAHLTRR